jgi:hypothetical protein
MLMLMLIIVSLSRRSASNRTFYKIMARAARKKDQKMERYWRTNITWMIFSWMRRTKTLTMMTMKVVPTSDEILGRASTASIRL